MKANAKSTWECVWPSRKGREGEREEKIDEDDFAIQAGFDDKRA